jgi:hypothetical protein
MQIFAAIIVLFSALCLWQLWSGMQQMKSAKAHPENPNAAALHKIGNIRAWAGGGMLAANILLNLSTLRMLF